jgi:LPS sulfotransferase NodH
LLCDLLTQTGEHGEPDEYLDIRKVVYRALYDEAGGTNAGYIPWLLTHRSSPNGAFGLKLHWNQGVNFVRGARANAMAHARLGYGFRAVSSLTQGFDDLRLVWVQREDRVLQAVSHYRARNTNQWVRPDGEPGARRPDPPFDADEIERSLRWLTRVDRGWQRFFDRISVQPFVVVYERLAADPNPILHALGEHLGVPITATLEPRLERQGTNWSVEMRDRYIAERGLPTLSAR